MKQQVRKDGLSVAAFEHSLLCHRECLCSSDLALTEVARLLQLSYGIGENLLSGTTPSHPILLYIFRKMQIRRPSVMQYYTSDSDAALKVNKTNRVLDIAGSSACCNSGEIFYLSIF